MTGKEVAEILINRLLNLGFIVHRYNSVTTSSIYLKLDYGVACGIRIADHNGRKRYHYRFNVMKNYKGNRAINRDGLISYFFDYTELDEVIKEVQREKVNKIYRYGEINYLKYMEQSSKDDLYTRFKRMEEKSAWIKY